MADIPIPSPICDGGQHEWHYVGWVPPSLSETELGLWQCRRCKTVAIGDAPYSLAEIARRGDAP